MSVGMDSRTLLGGSGPRGGGRFNSSRSLAISPNLEALLEHEERHRTNSSNAQQSCPQASFSPAAPGFITFNPTVPIGLPPPPRGPRKPRSPTASRTAVGPFLPLPAAAPVVTTDPPPRYSRNDPASLPEPPIASSSTSNPYINPAPTLQEVLRVESPGPPVVPVGPLVVEARSSRGRQPVESTGLLHDVELIPLRSTRPDGETGNQQHQSKRSKSPPLRVDKVLNIAFSRFQDGIPEETSPRTPSPRPGQTRTKQEGLMMNTTHREQQTTGSNCQSPSGGETQRRPLLSHGAPSSPPSSAGHTDSTHPASTIDPRISISSTTYTSSSVSQSRSMFDHRSPSPIIPPSRISSLRQQDVDRQSFIELASPDQETSSEQSHEGRSRTESPTRPASPGQITAQPPPNQISQLASTSDGPFNASQIQNGNREGLPPTTNFLNDDARADLIRKSRKLAKMFGQPPAANALLPESASGSAKGMHQRGAASLSGPDHAIAGHSAFSAWPGLSGAAQYFTTHGRRHSSPLSPKEFSFLGDDEAEPENRGYTPSGFGQKGGPKRSSLTSFIDLSDEEGVDHYPTHHSSSATGSPKASRKRRPLSPSNRSLFENMSPEEQAEEDRRRNREKLAKLHRFLGSRVPANLVFGFDTPPAEAMLPPAAFDSAILGENDESTRKNWMRRRRSSSAAALPSTYPNDLQRLKEDLNDKEKAINVRRAQKMEKVFGVAPPQTLYHTRPSQPSAPPTAYVPGYTDENPSVLSNTRNQNRTAYTKPKPKKGDRPGTSESSTQLLPKDSGSQDIDDIQTRTGRPHRGSIVYTHYQHSLNSLNDILDRDDRESLAELHEYLNNGDIAATPFTLQNRRPSIASVKSERRRSLPVRTSMTSLASEYSIATPTPEVSDFQLRRRKAAKLTQFFGVDYRDLINDVLESIESGLEHERKRGTLNPEEMEDLHRRLRSLRTKREGSR